MNTQQHPIRKEPLFGPLPLELSENIRSVNPWWENKPMPTPPRFHRRPFQKTLKLLQTGITPAVVLRGTRRVGKTVLLRQIIEHFLSAGIDPRRLLYVSFDDLPTVKEIKEPVLAVCRWFEDMILGVSFNECANCGRPAYIFLDEVQNLDAWAPQVKNLVDNHGVRVLITGSSSLRIESGRDSLAGRITSIEMGPLLLREIAELRFGSPAASCGDENGPEKLLSREFWMEAADLDPDERDLRNRSFTAFSERGGYPIAHERHDVSWHELADYLNETVIKRAIQHDLRMGPRGQKRDEKLLEEVFRLCCRYAGQTAGQAAFVPEIQQALSGNIGWNRILSYLRFLDGTLLIRLVPPIELRLKRKKSAPKLCLSDHALRASWLQEVIPLDPEGLAAHPHLTDMAGRLAESVLGYFLSSIPHLDLAHFPERSAEPEVDFVLTIGTKRIPVEVKYRKRIDPFEDTRGLRSFLEKTVYNAPFGVLVTLEDNVKIPDPRIVPIALSSVLWAG